jgi:solute:Na+ symporter, SSS family
MMAPPIVAAFMLGIFWKRINGKGAFIGLMAGLLLGIINIVYKVNVGVSIFGEMHFLLTVPFYFLWSALVMIVVSFMTEKPPLEKTENLTFTLEEFRRETAELKKVPLLDNYRFWSYLLIAFCIFILILFW